MTENPYAKFEMPIEYTHFRKDHEFAVKEFGHKVIKAEGRHWDQIGKNPSTCKKLYGIGHILNDLPGFEFSFNNYGNHVWLPQPNLKDDNTMYVCFNCGSLMINKKFIPYTDLK